MSNVATKSDQELARILGGQITSNLRSRYARWILMVVALAAIMTALLHKGRNPDNELRYETSPVTRDTLRVVISATGNLAPTNKVNVGSEQSGIVEKVLAQENDHVKKGQVLAQLDTSRLRDAVQRSEAALGSAQAKLAQAQSTVQQDRASLDRYREVSRLSGGKVPSKTEMENAEATLVRAEAEEKSAHADVDQARASLSSDQTNLAKASIRSPVDGVVLSRAVERGQTVAASLEVATLFTVAEDLREMELKVDVDEADVGGVRSGQTATFTVDAYPERKYSAKVIRVAYGSQTKENVVSYSTLLKVKNDDLSLRPGMTATAQIASVSRVNVLLVPNAALRFTPAAEDASTSKGLLRGLMPGPPRDRSTQPVSNPAKGSAQQVWILKEGKPLAVPVTVGVSDGKSTESTSGNLKEGMNVITDSTARK
jgi:HlyD family secretion protein